MDLKVRDQSGRRFAVEMQLVAFKDLNKRALYYWAKLFTETLRESENYGKLEPAVVICFVNQSLFPETSDYHLRFRLQDARAGVVFSEDIEIHTIDLKAFHHSEERLITSLDYWSYFLRNVPMPLPPALAQEPEIVRAWEELQKIAQDPEERERYLKAKMRQMDELARLNDAEERGMLIGEIRGLQRLLKRPIDSRKSLSDRTFEELKKLCFELEAEASALENGNC